MLQITAPIGGAIDRGRARAEGCTHMAGRKKTQTEAAWLTGDSWTKRNHSKSMQGPGQAQAQRCKVPSAPYLPPYPPMVNRLYTLQCGEGRIGSPFDQKSRRNERNTTVQLLHTQAHYG